MRKTLLATISAVVLGVSVMVLPLYMWHQINYPEKVFTPLNIRQEALELETYDAHLEKPVATPLYFTLALSFIASAIAYALSKRLA